MLNETQLAQVGNFDTSTIAALRPALAGGVDALTAAGALSLSFYESTLAVSGTMAFTLAAPTVAGQKKRITCISAASTPLGTVTVTSPDTTTGFVLPSTLVFTAVGQSIELVATSGLLWRANSLRRAGVQILVVGTTVTTGMVLAQNYSLSVTGTVSSTTGSNRGVPNGLIPGEIIVVSQSTAASTPVGNIEGVFVTLANVTATDLQAWGATTDTCTLQWNGARWLVVTATGVTVA
jgi:hypothetical protein